MEIKKEQNEETKKGKKGIKFYLFFIMGIILFFSGAICMQLQKRNDYDEQIKQLEYEINKQNEINEELKRQNEYQDSDEFIEKIAREQLGMIKPNEKIFIDQNK